jgi:type III restriction enzyme
MRLFGSIKKVVRQWLDNYLECVGGTYPAQLLYQQLNDMACERINNAINRAYIQTEESGFVLALTDPFNPAGSTNHVNFFTTKDSRWETDPRKCPVNYAILDSGWEGEFCRVVESHPKVLRYVKNQGLGLEIPYTYQGEPHTYVPDFIVWVDDGRGEADPLQLIVEIKGYRGDAVQAKHQTIKDYWVPGVNALKAYGRWAFAEFTDVFEMEEDFADKVAEQWNQIMEQNTARRAEEA